jgi:hypothetical protein
MIKPIRIKKEKPVDEPMDHIVLTDKISVHTYIRRKKKMVSIALTTDLDGEPLAVADLNLHEARLVHAALGVHIREFE